jgi:hypothetical protein
MLGLGLRSDGRPHSYIQHATHSLALKLISIVSKDQNLFLLDEVYKLGQCVL